MGHMRGVRNMGHAVRTQDGDSHGLDSAPRAKSPQGMARLPLLLTLGFVGLGGSWPCGRGCGRQGVIWGPP